MYVALDGRAAGLVAVADTFKADSTVAIRALHRMGVHVAMITGGNERTARAVARQVGIDGVLADVLPDQKAAEVRALQDEGKIVAMVGDGINDSPALAQADVDIAIATAIGTGTDVAIEAADHPHVRRVAGPGHPVAAGLLYPVAGTLLSPRIAAAAMALSSSSVVVNTARLNAFRTPPVSDGSPEQGGISGRGTPVAVQPPR